MIMHFSNVNVSRNPQLAKKSRKAGYNVHSSRGSAGVFEVQAALKHSADNSAVIRAVCYMGDSFVEFWLISPTAPFLGGKCISMNVNRLLTYEGRSVFFH